MANNQELRQGLNKIEVVGVVKESKLKDGKTENGKYINGSLIVKTGEFSEVEVKVFVNEKNSKGNIKKSYTTLKQILDKEYQTIADGLSEEEAVKVSIWGNNGFTPQFREEMFKPENAPEVVTKISIDLGFGNINIRDDIKPENYKATFDVEMFIDTISDEMKKDADGEEEETGRVIIKGWCPVYGGKVIPLHIIAGIVEDEDGTFDFAEQIRDNVDEKTTINLWGNIDYKTIVEKVKKGGGLGRAKVEEKRTYINDIVGIGGNVIEDEDKEFDEDLIKEAIKQREIDKEEVEAKAEKGNKKSRGLGNRGKKEGKIAKDKIPF